MMAEVLQLTMAEVLRLTMAEVLRLTMVEMAQILYWGFLPPKYLALYLTMV
jgi:hypothetical protein